MGRRVPTESNMGINLLDARTFRRGKSGLIKFGVVPFLLPVMALVMMLAVPSMLISAQGPDQQAIVNGDFTLHGDQTINGNYTIAARSVEIDAGSQIKGD